MPKFVSTSTPTVAPCDAPARRADPTLPAEADHARAGADRALLDLQARLGQSPRDVARLHVRDPRVAQPAVVALPDDRDDDVVDAHSRIGGDRGHDGSVIDAPDGVRGGEVDRCVEQPPLPDLERPGQLACTVEHRRSRRHRQLRRHDCRHARHLDGDMADRDSDVGDRVPGTGLELADQDPVVARPCHIREGSSLARVTLSLPFAWSDDCLRHEPLAEVWVGVRTPATEVPARATAIRTALTAAGAREVAATPHDDEALLAVHDRALIEFLRSSWDEWEAADLPNERVVPYIFHRPELTGGRPPRTPAAVWARPGLFAYDTMTLIGPGTWEAARAAVDVALTAVDLVDGGEPVAYALLPASRPPRTALAVRRLVLPQQLGDRRGRVAAPPRRDRRARRHRRAPRQRRAGALPGTSRRQDRIGARRPGCRLVPPLRRVRLREERRCEPQPAGGSRHRGRRWLDAVRQAAAFAEGAQGLVLALGVDAAAADPESPLQVTAEGYREAGRILRELGLPTVVVQEGGYDLATIGELVVATLTGLAA